MRARTRQMAVVVTAAVAIGIAIAGCTGGTDSAATDSQTSDRESVTISHRNGNTELSSVPSRIFVADEGWMDSLLAFDVSPVGYDIGPRDGDARGPLPWQSNLASTSKELYGKDGAPFEQVAALDPDLILGYNYESADAYEQLNGIAPTIGILGAQEVDPWEDRIRAVGKLLRRDEDAQDIIDATNNSIAALTAGLPGLQGKTAVLGKYFTSNGQIGLVVDPDDGTNKVFAHLGMSVPEQLIDMAEAGGTSGRVLISPEQLDAISSDVLVLGAAPDDLAKLPGFEQLPSVRGGGMALVDDAVVAAFNLPSSLSIPWALDRIEPALRSAAG